MSIKKKRIAILGSTGSIGTQALDVIKSHPELFEVEALTANRNSELLIQQSIEFKPNCVVIVDESKFKEVQEALDPHQIKVYAGKEALAQVVEMDSIDLVLTALVGYSGHYYRFDHAPKFWEDQYAGILGSRVLDVDHHQY